MAVAAHLDLPYERQAHSTHMCGAAALCMVYRSFGMTCSQDEIWPAIAAPPTSGRSRALTHLLCAEAVRRGLAAMTLQVRDALGLLYAAFEQDVRVIVHHRQSLNAWWGHYSVLVGMDEENIALHDPWLGPARCLDHAAWLKLWRPGRDNREVRGNLAVLIAQGKAELLHCRVCQRRLPQKFPCPQCRKEIPLRPGVMLGCVDSHCPARTWDRLFCPWCDAELDRVE
ncbi:MAG TPA: papain-like cysteine protease family protein [Pirellulales bacterium]|jgi:hypothetical protein|nr:papain-like cysteine protease family protein [Pirellulales bacterium]